MQFTKLTLFSLAAVASAQQPNVGDLLAALPTDLQQYAEGLITNTAVVGAVEGLIANSGVQNALEAVTGAGANPTAFVANLENAVESAIKSEPTAEQAVINSVVGVITSLGATDGLYSDVGAIATGAGPSGTGAVASAVSAASTALSNAATSGTAAAGSSAARSSGSMVTSAASSGASASAASAASSSRANNVSTGVAAAPSGMAMGAFVGAIAGLAALL